MSAMASQITSLTIIYLAVYSSRRSKKTSKFRVTGLCEGNSPHKGTVTRKMFPFDDVIMLFPPPHRSSSNLTNTSIFRYLPDTQFALCVFAYVLIHCNMIMPCFMPYFHISNNALFFAKYRRAFVFHRFPSDYYHIWHPPSTSRM